MKAETERAYAILGLAPGASAAQLKREHRRLVKKWHPDRFASDPAAQGVATEQLARINAAYRLLMDGGAGADPTPASPAATPRAPRPRVSFDASGRMSREEIDRLVAAINGGRGALGAPPGPWPPELVVALAARLRAMGPRRVVTLLLLGALIVTGAAWFLAWLSGRELGDQLWFSWFIGGGILLIALGLLALRASR